MTGATTNPWAATFGPARLAQLLQRLRDDAANGHPGAVACMRYASGDEQFALYLMIADRRCRRMCGLSIFDLADFGWRAAYDDARNLGEVTREALMADDLGRLFLTQLHGEGLE